LTLLHFSRIRYNGADLKRRYIASGEYAHEGQRVKGHPGGSPMTFDETLVRVLELLQREGRVSYRALRRRFDLDEEYLEDLKAEIIQAKKLAVDEDGAVLGTL